MRGKKQGAVYLAIGAALGLVMAVYKKTLKEISREIIKKPPDGKAQKP